MFATYSQTVQKKNAIETAKDKGTGAKQLPQEHLVWQPAPQTAP